MIQRAAVMNTNESIATAKVRELSAEELRFTIKSSGKFSSTRELCGAKEFVGQEPWPLWSCLRPWQKGSFPFIQCARLTKGLRSLREFPQKGVFRGWNL